MEPTETERRELRLTFGGAAEQYDRWRPTYPSELVEALIDVAAIPAAGIALEIGCGTGQLTVPLSARVGTLHAVDLAASLLQLAQRRLANQTNIVWHHTPFEQLQIDPSTIDLVAAATSFHWLDPRLRYQLVAQLLTARGSLAIINTHHLAGGTPGFFEATQPLYIEHLGSAPGFALPAAVDESRELQRIAASGLFEPPSLRAFEVEEELSGASLAGVVGTYSPIMALDHDVRCVFLDRLSRLVDDRFGGSIRRRTGYALVVARRRA